MPPTLTATPETFPMDGTFTISRGSRTEAQVVTVAVTDGGHTGHGECVPYARYGETVESVIAQVEAAGPMETPRDAQTMPAGAARNAVDCAFWDLEAKRSGEPVWQLLGLPEPQPVTTAYTLSLETPDTMRVRAAENAHRPLLKIKLGGEGDLERLRAVRSGAPDATLIIDANEGWTPEIYAALAPELMSLGVAMVEQPLPAGEDEALRGMERPLPVCADEACHDCTSLPKLVGKYDMINIKLDKTGGLTEALALRDEAREMGFRIMVGCMVGTSLAMAPALLVAQGAEIVDLDGPLLLAKDRETPLVFAGSIVYPPVPALWG